MKVFPSGVIALQLIPRMPVESGSENSFQVSRRPVAISIR
jgi:hypothetical protein